jgi:probable HAF family extracellular repeat protein
VGGYDTAGFAVHGFLLDRGRYKTVDVPGVSKTVAFRVNARGRSWASTRTRVADAMASCSRRVSSRRSTSQAHLPRRWASAARSSAHTSIALRGAPVAFSGGRGVYTPIDFPGGPGDHRVHINNRGQIAGTYADTGGRIRGYLRSQNGDYTGIDAPGASLTFPFGVNNRGKVLGYYLDGNLVRHGFLFANGVLTTIDHPLASSDTQAHDLNDGARSSASTSAGPGPAVTAEAGASPSGVEP